VGEKLWITTLGGEIVRIILVHLLTRGAQVRSRFRGQGVSERSKHVGTIIVLLAQPLPSRVTVIDVSPNGWTSNKPGLAWLKHFNTHTKASSVTRSFLSSTQHSLHSISDTSAIKSCAILQKRLIRIGQPKAGSLVILREGCPSRCRGRHSTMRT
jgi:hypothetical protein